MTGLERAIYAFAALSVGVLAVVMVIELLVT